MATTDVESIKQELAEINSFVRERFDPVAGEVGMLREETARRVVQPRAFRPPAAFPWATRPPA